MPHGLGSPRDFDPHFQADDPVLNDEELRLNAELLGGQPDEPEVENLGPEDPFEDAEVGEYLNGETVEGSPEELANLMAYLQMMQPEYVVTPADLRSLVEAEILTVDEARTYLEAKGVIST